MYSSIGRPHTSCSALGRFDFSRVLFPAARMIAVVLIGETATRLGFEPRQTGPKPVVLPLHYRVVTDVLEDEGIAGIIRIPRRGCARSLCGNDGSPTLSTTAAEPLDECPIVGGGGKIPARTTESSRRPA